MLPLVNTEAMNLHLAEISTQVTPGAHCVLTLDRAGWHQLGGKLRVPENISLLPLPAYSPELNPVENVWQFLRQNYLANSVFVSGVAGTRRIRLDGRVAIAVAGAKLSAGAFGRR